MDALVRIDSVCFPKALAYSKKHLSQYVRRPSGVVFLAEYSRHVIGFILAVHHKGRKRLHLVTVDVLPDYQGRGIGRYLLDAVLERARAEKVKYVQLEVATNNQKALHLYWANGFRIARRLNNYYADTLDGFLMVLNVQAENPDLKCDSRGNRPIICGVFDPDLGFHFRDVCSS